MIERKQQVINIIDSQRFSLHDLNPHHSTSNTLASILLGTLCRSALDEPLGLGYAYDKTFDARIEAVTREDVVRVARKYLGNYVLVTSSPEERPPNDP